MKKTVLIGGTSSGIDKATTRHLAREGWNVVATMRRPDEERELTSRADMPVTRRDVRERPTAAAIDVGIGIGIGARGAGQFTPHTILNPPVVDDHCRLKPGASG